jgi:hypothetical protein
MVAVPSVPAFVKFEGAGVGNAGASLLIHVGP